MKVDRHGMRFVIWIFYFIFSIAIVLLLGFLQFSLIKPYYRTNQIRIVQHVTDEITEYVLNHHNSQEALAKATQLTVDNNVCVVLYNDNGNVIYDLDSLGTGCAFHIAQNAINDSPISLRDGKQLQSYLNEHEGEASFNIFNSRTNQEMVIYGRKISANLGNYYLYVNSPLEPVDNIVTFFSQQYVLYTIIIIALASLFSFFISNRIAKPIMDMKDEATKLSNANYDATFDGGGFTETKELASTLNGATDKLSKIDELRKDLIANVSHDIKTPLTSIKAYAEMIKDISGDNEEKRNEHLNVIIQEADYLDHLVTDMSELSKMQSGNYMLRYSNFDLAEKIKDIIRLNEVLIKEGDLHVHTDMPEELTVYADEIKISQVIYNFLSNAIKHTPDGKNIWIKAYLLNDEETVRVEIKDEGEGIKEEDIPFIWDRYQKTSKSFSRSLTSTGLGLSIVKAILDTHKASYGVESKVGKGSTFWFEIHSPKEEENDTE